MARTLFNNAVIFDGVSRDLREGHELVEGGTIREVSETQITALLKRVRAIWVAPISR